MKKFVVNITETSIRTVIIEAEDVYDAEEKVSNLWNDSKIVLDYQDFDHADFCAQGEANDADINNFKEVK